MDGKKLLDSIEAYDEELDKWSIVNLKLVNATDSNFMYKEISFNNN